MGVWSSDGKRQTITVYLIYTSSRFWKGLYCYLLIELGIFIGNLPSFPSYFVLSDIHWISQIEYAFI